VVYASGPHEEALVLERVSLGLLDLDEPREEVVGLAMGQDDALDVPGLVVAEGGETAR